MTDECGCEADGRAPRAARGDGLANPDRTNPFADGVDRRRLLRASGAVGATAALAGCSGDGGAGDEGIGDDPAPTVFVFNNGDRTVSVIDAEADELLDTVFLGTTASFPANQYTTGIDAGEPAGEGNVLPFRCTARVDGEYLLVENGEGTLGSDPEVPRRGSESVWDVSDPENPAELANATRDDGLPGAPITSEVDPNNEAAYLLIPGEGVGVIDLETFEYEAPLDVGGSSIAAAWGPTREKLYVPVQDANRVAVIEHASRSVIATIDAGEAPTGAVAGTVRPAGDAVASVRASLAALGITVGDMEATFCPDDHCYCG